MSDDRIDVKIGAQLAGLNAGLAEAKAAVRGAVTDMKTNITDLGSLAQSIRTPFVALTAVLAGGALFKDAISGTLEWTSGVVQLSKRLGITTEQASGLKVALDHLGLSTDEYSTMVGKVTRTMRTNEQALQSLGIRTHESNGEWRNSQSIMADVIDQLSHMKAGTDRNVAAQAIFGARIGDLTKFLRLNKEMMEESAEKAKQFNLIVGGDGEAKLRAYKNAMADVHLISESLKVQVGTALIPILTDLGKWFGEHGPAMAELFKDAITVVRMVLRDCQGDIETIRVVWEGFVNQINFGDEALGKSFKAMAKGDFTAAKDALISGWKDIREQAWITGAETQRIAEETSAALRAIRYPGKAGKDSKAPAGGDTTDGGDPGKDPLEALRKKWALEAAGFKLQEAQAGDSFERIVALKRAELARVRDLFTEHSTEYLAAATELENQLQKGQQESGKIFSGLQTDAREQERAALAKRKQDWESLYSGISNGIQSSVLGVIEGTQTMAAAIRNLLRSITLEYISLGVKTLIAHKATELAKTGATAQGTAQRVALEYWAAVKSVAVGAWQAIARIGQYAIEGAAAAFKSIAAIPIFGPALAPAAAAAAGLAIGAFAGRIASARGGYDIPSGINPVTQLHQNEMVLPASLADRIRGMTDGAGSGGQTHIHIHAVDTKGFVSLLEKNGDHIVRMINGKDRNFRFEQG